MNDKIEFVQQMQRRTKDFAIRSIRLYRALPKTGEARIVGKQYLRSATSLAANYRAVCRARSNAEYFAKLSIVVEETDESLFWLELLVEAEIMSEQKLANLKQEATELLSVFASARKNTTRTRR
ncbi:four helix bundle protein [Spirosoma montaniterrae]|uniref:Four helix bundle protein n=1 Tax=Spirosoma montaniterrae TaxID=1178516 RepID=A0A1P9WSJ3_9BACT|nr:four helix bundle protein [Spirosoma montaniterrae]AQG78327.1 four helix bundle protein [Spirosoma montaniterrae]